MCSWKKWGLQSFFNYCLFQCLTFLCRVRALQHNWDLLISFPPPAPGDLSILLSRRTCPPWEGSQPPFSFCDSHPSGIASFLYEPETQWKPAAKGSALVFKKCMKQVNYKALMRPVPPAELCQQHLQPKADKHLQVLYPAPPWAVPSKAYVANKRDWNVGKKIQTIAERGEKTQPI